MLLLFVSSFYHHSCPQLMFLSFLFKESRLLPQAFLLLFMSSFYLIERYWNILGKFVKNNSVKTFPRFIPPSCLFHSLPVNFTFSTLLSTRNMITDSFQNPYIKVNITRERTPLLFVIVWKI